MNENMNKKQKISMVVAILSIILILTGVTFAAVSFSAIGDQNLVKSGKVSMSYTESSNVINLTNALPTEDEIGKNSTEFFDFTIMSNADTNVDDNEGIKIPYNLIIEPKAVDSDKDALTSEQIKVYLTKVEGATETEVLAPTKISKLKAVDTNFNLYSTENVHKNNNGTITTNYRLRAWIDYGVESKDWNQTSKQKQYKFGVNVDATGELNLPISGAEMLVRKANPENLDYDTATAAQKLEMWAHSHPETLQLKATTDYRYAGANPNNYIYFNNEYWRIIGVFDVDDGTGKLEKRIKIIREENIGDIKWDASTTYGENDWSKASLMQLLNKGDYWNRKGLYEATGLTEEAKGQIADAVWYLGGAKDYDSASNGLASHWYGYERGKTVYYSTRPTSWKGKVGLMYPSDYTYATGGGTTTNRDACLAKELSNWNDSSVSDCPNNDWLRDTRNGRWTLTPWAGNYSEVFLVGGTGCVAGFWGGRGDYPVLPSVYLRSDIEIGGGSGTELDPYFLTSKPTMPEPVEAVGGAKTIVEKVGTDGLVAVSHRETEQLQATTDYRYTGANPNNYITFNNEEGKWRIIGVFDVDDGTGKLEKRIKIIRDSLGRISWDSNGLNDWSSATVMKLLNEGDYWNRAGDYEANGLTDDAKSQIVDAKWYLGGTKDYTIVLNGLANHFYKYERSTTVYTGKPISWKGKVGLMYPSDYGYATGGGTTANREACLAKEMYNWKSSEVSDCKNNDWLYDTSYAQWTLTPYSDNARYMFYVNGTGNVNNYKVSDTYILRPTVYLKSDIELQGEGRDTNPYKISG